MEGVEGGRGDRQKTDRRQIDVSCLCLNTCKVPILISANEKLILD